MDEMIDVFELIDIFEVNENGEVIENYSWDAYQINEALDEGRYIVQQGWQDKRLFSPVWDFESGDWVEGLSEIELHQRELEIIEQENQPNEYEQLKQENEMLAMAVMELSSFMLKGGK